MRILNPLNLRNYQDTDDQKTPFPKNTTFLSYLYEVTFFNSVNLYQIKEVFNVGCVYWYKRLKDNEKHFFIKELLRITNE